MIPLAFQERIEHPLLKLIVHLCKPQIFRFLFCLNIWAQGSFDLFQRLLVILQPLFVAQTTIFGRCDPLLLVCTDTEILIANDKLLALLGKVILFRPGANVFS